MEEDQHKQDLHTMHGVINFVMGEQIIMILPTGKKRNKMIPTTNMMMAGTKNDQAL